MPGGRHSDNCFTCLLALADTFPVQPIYSKKERDEDDVAQDEKRRRGVYITLSILKYAKPLMKLTTVQMRPSSGGQWSRQRRREA